MRIDSQYFRLKKTGKNSIVDAAYEMCAIKFELSGENIIIVLQEIEKQDAYYIEQINRNSKHKAAFYKDLHIVTESILDELYLAMSQNKVKI